jgi:hypothetical protein
MAFVAFGPDNHPAHRAQWPLPLKFEPDGPAQPEEIEQKTWWLALTGKRIPPEFFPKRAIMQKKRNLKYDILGVWSENWAVNERVKVILETIAPGQVEFIAFDMVTKSGSPVNEHRYFFTNILPRIDTIDWTATNLVRGQNPMSGRPSVDWPESGPLGAPPQITINKKEHPGIHIWHESSLCNLGHWVFVSNELAAALNEAGIQKFYYISVTER